MSSLNKIMLIGHLGKDPEVRYTSDGTPVATFSLATSENWTDKNGTRQERTEWHNIVAWRRLAELSKRFLVKGRQVYVEGSLRTRQWQDRDGNTRYTTEVIAQRVQFLGGPRGERTAEEPAPTFETNATPTLNAGSSDDVPF